MIARIDIACCTPRRAQWPDRNFAKRRTQEIRSEACRNGRDGTSISRLATMANRDLACYAIMACIVVRSVRAGAFARRRLPGFIPAGASIKSARNGLPIQ